MSANLNAVSKYDKALCDEILRINNTKSTLELIQNKNGEYNLIFNGSALHSKENAKEEAQKIVDKIEDLEDKNSIRIVWGLGLGYLADEFIQRSKGAVIIYEANLEILRGVFEILEFSENLAKNNVFITNKLHKLLEYTDFLSDKETKITVSFLSSYFQLFKEDIYKTAQIVERTRGEKQANINTINKIAPKAALNTFANLDKIIKTPLVKSLKDIYKGKCALIASSGPSLEENIETIKNNRGKFILFAVGPSLKLLDKHGIKPDFLCVVEPIDTSGQLEGIDTSSVNLIFEPFSNPYLWDLKIKNRFLFFSKDNFLNDWLSRILNIDISNLKTIGTVSYCALSSAAIMGFEKIILCGQNLAFKDGKCYAKGSAYEDLECLLNPDTNKYEIKAKDFEKYKKRLLGSKKLNIKNADYYVKNYIKQMNKTLYSVLGQDGKMLPTQACYALFIKHFERFALDNPDICYINSSSGGAQINGFQNMPLNDALLKCEAVSEIKIPYIIPQYNIEKLKEAKEAALCKFLRIQSIVSSAREYQEEYLKEFTRRKTFNKTTEKLEEKIKNILSGLIKNYYGHNEIYFLCASYTNRFFDGIKKIKTLTDTAQRQKTMLLNLNILKGFEMRLNEAVNYLSDK